MEKSDHPFGWRLSVPETSQHSDDADLKPDPTIPPGWELKGPFVKKKTTLALGEKLQITHTAWHFKARTDGYLQDIGPVHLVLRGEDGQYIEIPKSSIQKIKRQAARENRMIKAGIWILVTGILVAIMNFIFIVAASAALLPFTLLDPKADEVANDAGRPGRTLAILLIIAALCLMIFSSPSTIHQPFSTGMRVERIGEFPETKQPGYGESDGITPSMDIPRA